MRSLIPVLLLLPTVLAAEITFDSSMESGNGSAFTQVAPRTWSFELEPDTNSEDTQWFLFDVKGAAGQTLTFQLLKTGATNVRSHWNAAVPIYSTDGGETWRHMKGPASHGDGTYTFQHAFTADPERLAFHFPYTWTRAKEHLDAWDDHPAVTRRTIGQSVQGRPIELLTVTEGDLPTSDKLGIWFIARQHAAEVTGSFKAEGLLNWLLSEDEEAVLLRRKAVINIVPMVNPDGVVVGNYRDNANGVNLNRVWNGTATEENAPEVKAIADAIAEWVKGGNSYVFFGDLHSTSGSSPHFAFHADPSQKPPLYPTPETYGEDTRRFLALVDQRAPHFDVEEGVSTSRGTAVAAQSQRYGYGVLSYTFEGGYIRHFDGPTPEAFMTPEAHLQVGEAIGRALVEYYGLGER